RILNVRSVSLHLDQHLHMPRQPGKIRIERPLAPIRNLVLRMKMVKMSPERPPHIFREQPLAVQLPSLQPIPPLAAPAPDMSLNPLLVFLINTHQTIPPHAKKARPHSSSK